MKQGKRSGSDSPSARWDAAASLACTLAALVFYLWLGSAGTWNRFPNSTSYHGELAQAFLHGQLAFLQEPDPALLALTNPYDAAQLEGVPYPLDLSLYKGKFYAYFGPVPALLLAPVQYLIHTVFLDRLPSFVFTCGLLIVQALLVLRIRRLYFPDTSRWYIAAALLVLQLAVPTGLMVDFAGYYATAAVMGGAFFLMAGLYAALAALTAPTISRRKLVLAGMLWAAAVGTRITHIFAIALLTLALCALMLSVERGPSRLRHAALSVAALLAPVGLGMVGLADYNYARFGSPFETGLKYQLNPQSMEKFFTASSTLLFSPLYVVQNLANYLLRPFSPHGIFPFADLQAPWVTAVIPGLPLPAIYTPEWVVGLLWAAPFIVFSAFTVGHAVRGPVLALDRRRIGLGGVLLGLWVALLASGAVVMSFFWAAERYVPDFVYPLYMLSAIGFWLAAEQLSRTPVQRAVFALISLCLVAASVLIGNLLALGQAKVQFDLLNPGAWGHLQQLAGGDLRRFHPELWLRLRELLGK
jgi:hypothetical protein